MSSDLPVESSDSDLGSLQTESAVPAPPSRVTYHVGGLRGWLLGQSGRVSVDFESETISQGDRSFSFGELRILELRSGTLAASDGAGWIFLDAMRARDESGAALLDWRGGLQPGFARVLQALRDRVSRARHVELSADEAARSMLPIRFSFRYAIRVDVGLVVLTVLGLGLFLGFEYLERGRLPISGFTPRLGITVGLLLALAGWFVYWRLSSSVTFGSEEVRVNRGFFTRRIPWSEVSGIRQQGLELELAGRRCYSVNLAILNGEGAPLVVRRGMRPALTPLGAHFLHWVCSRAPLQPERPVSGTALDRSRSRFWILTLVSINALMYLLSSSPDALGPEYADLSFAERLDLLGARTGDSFQEPWRLFTALFLHGNIVHLGFNMLVLASLAPWLLRVFGWWRGTLVYVGSGVLGNAAAQLFVSDPDTFLSVGASTAILGMIGAFLGAVYRRPRSLPLAVRARFRWAIPVVVLLTLGSGQVITNIDNAGHLGGFLAGFALAWLIPPRELLPEDFRTAPEPI